MRARPLILLVAGALAASVLPGLPLGHAPADAETFGRVRLSGTLAPDETVTLFTVSPDGSRAGFLIEDGSGQAQLFTAPIDGTEPTPTPVSVSTTGMGLGSFTWSPDSQWVAYRGELTSLGVQHVYSRRADGTGSQHLLSSTVAGEVGSTPRITPDSAHVTWRGDLELVGRQDLYAAPIDGTGSQTRLSSSAAPGDDSMEVGFWAFPEGSDVVVYGGDLRLPDVSELYARPYDASGPQVRLNTDPAGAGPSSVSFTPDGSRAVYAAELDTAGVLAWYSRPVDGSGSQATLSPPAAGTGEVTPGFGIRFSESTGRAVFAGDLTTDGVRELYSAPWDGSAPAIRLNDAPEPGAGQLPGSSGGWGITPDGRTVVYSGDLLTAGRVEVFSAPVDAPGGQVRLSASPSGEDVMNLQGFAPDSSRVVYRGELEVSGRRDVYSAPVDAADGQVRLAEGTPGMFGAFARVPDVGDRVVISGQLEGASETGLWSIPFDGGTLTRLDIPNPPGETFDPFVITDDATRVIHVGDLTTPGTFELYSSPTDRADDQVRLNEDLQGTGELDTFIGGIPTPDSRWVVWRSGEDTGDATRFEVFASDLGQQPPRAPEPATATAGVEQVTVTWTPPAGGTAVTGYEITCTPDLGDPVVEFGGPDDTEVVVDGLRGGTTHTCTVLAHNDGGTSPFATAAPVTPLVPVELVRYAGTDRYDTARLVGIGEFDPTGVATAFLATGGNFPDALAGVPAAARVGAPLLLVASSRVPEPTIEALQAFFSPVGRVLGGPGAVADDLLDTLAPLTSDLGRVFGTNRYATAAAISDAYDPAEVDTVYVATGGNYPDALSGGPAAHADGAPLLLVTPTSVPTATTEALERLAPDTIVVLGGDAAVGPDVVAELGQHADTVAQLAGANRYVTAALVAQRFAPADVDTVYVATGGDYPDALAGGAAVARAGGVLLLVTRDTVPDATATELARLQPRRIVVLGGNAAIAETLDTELATYLVD